MDLTRKIIGCQVPGAMATALGAALILCLAGPASAIVPPSIPAGSGVQCPNDIDYPPLNFSISGDWADADWYDIDRNGNLAFDADPNVVCARIGGTDGYVKVPDGNGGFTEEYTFGFMDLTHVPEHQIPDYKMRANLPAPTFRMKEGQSLFLTLTNLGFRVRPDLDDPHTIHWHGFRNAAASMDGVPELSVAVPAASEFTYYYKPIDPGTYAYHCHVEPTEHIGMGMVGTIIVEPAQNNEAGGAKYAYNDGHSLPDTSYDREVVLHLHDYDTSKNHNLETIQEGSNQWSHFRANYYTLNGRTYPETLLPSSPTETELGIPSPVPVLDPMTNFPLVEPADMAADPPDFPDNWVRQPYGALIEANEGDRVLVRLNNLTYQSHSVTIPGIPMHVVGEDATLMRGPTGVDISFTRVSYNIAGGEQADIILDLDGVTPGTYFLYGRELYSQAGLGREQREDGLGSNNNHGLVTEIRVYPPDTLPVQE